MNILWLTNIPLPEVSLLMNEKPLPFGGWLVNASESLSNIKQIDLSIAFPKSGLSVEKFQGDKIKYYTFPPVNGNDSSHIKKNKCLEEIIEQANPDIIHIFGTEYAHTLAMVNVCRMKNIKVVISIQGLVSIYAQHYMANLPTKVQNRYTFRDFVKHDNLILQQKKFIKRGQFEIEALRKVNHVIGRTTWDKACTAQINPDVKYHYCNESLRDKFYKGTWDINECEKHSIFVSQGSYPIKGLHFMIEAMPLILKQCPGTKLYIGGHDITKSNTLKEKLKISSYGKYIKELIKKYNLQQKVFFTGILDETQMRLRYLKSNAFVCPSSIENSPNSLGEAMILGVPCVASDVGGVSDLIKHKEEGFIYQMDASYMLAHYVCEIFRNHALAIGLSENARKHAIKTHERDENTKRTMDIYGEIFNGINDYEKGI